MQNSPVVSFLVLILLLLAVPGLSADDAATELLKKHGWKVESEGKPSTLEVPGNLKGLPWFHYQQASKDADLDLGVVTGKKVVLRTFLLQTRGAKEGSKISASLVIYQERVVGAWLYTDAPIAPGIFSITDHRFPANL